MIRTHNRPRISPAEAAEAARVHFGLTGELTALPGERDRNYLLREEGGSGWVVKVSSPDEPEDQLAFESRLLLRLEGDSDVPAPPLRPTGDGEAVARHPRPDGGAWRIRVLSHLPGRIMADVRPWTGALLEDLGRRAAGLDLRLAALDVRPPDRSGFIWALDEAVGVMERGLHLMDPEQQTVVQRCMDDARDALDRARALPRQLIHGDLNDHNILVDAAGRVSGLLDFGDAHEAPAVFDLAIAVAYAMLGVADPIHAAARVVQGYHQVRPLGETELDVLFPLARARLGASVCIAASRQDAGESEVDDYLLVSEAPAWQCLEVTREVHPHLARAHLRHACGLVPVPRSPDLASWLGGLSDVSPVVDVPEANDATGVLDLSVGSTLLNGRDAEDTPGFTGRVFGAMSDAGLTLGIGRYLEPRGVYLSEIFSGRPAEMPERRTVHMGIDLFTQAGAPVHAPLAAVVKRVHDNAGRLDYGPTVILEHASPSGPFWTLYGHLERASMEKLEEGRELAAGDAFARIGPYPENGDWPPHLHFQIITDLVGFTQDFPGVAAPRDVEVWKSLSPDPNLVLRLPLPTTFAAPRDLEERRRRLLAPNLSLSYRTPIHVVRGRGAFLYDGWGRAYLDCVNNVAHVGHEHPKVVEAARRQMGVLNTNTRYLHEGVLTYAERLAALFPAPLEVCFFVNSGSEANELALRLARTFTGRRGIVALEGGYHGNTQGLVDVSHYKFSRAGGEGAPPWVRAAAMPDDYRGRYRRDDPERARRYAAHVAEAAASLADAGHPPAAFLAESILSCGGQVEPPPGYLEAAYAAARDAGAVCIADEVQIGFGRVGSATWGFELQGVVPDIVTLGKPMGNGHPLGGVITTRPIAEAFANGMEFFSTYGGNPVSAAVGLAVLDVLEEEGLQAHADAVGGAFRDELASLAHAHPAVGDVRGRGLFLGVEIVSGRDEPTPDREAARYVVERMKEKGVLLSTDGPDDNVIKIKPPLPFADNDAVRVVSELDPVLAEDFVRARCNG